MTTTAKAAKKTTKKRSTTTVVAAKTTTKTPTKAERALALANAAPAEIRAIVASCDKLKRKIAAVSGPDCDLTMEIKALTKLSDRLGTFQERLPKKITAALARAARAVKRQQAEANRTEKLVKRAAKIQKDATALLAALPADQRAALIASITEGAVRDADAQD